MRSIQYYFAKNCQPVCERYVDDALVVDVRQRGPDGGRLAAQAVVALDVAAVAAGEAGEAAAAEQVTPELEGAAAV